MTTSLSSSTASSLPSLPAVPLSQQHPLVTQLISNVQKCGKKSLATRLVYQALSKLTSSSQVATRDAKTQDPAASAVSDTASTPVTMLSDSLTRVSPLVKLVSQKLGGKSVLTPTPLTPKQSARTAMMWIIQAARAKKGMQFSDALAAEIKSVLSGKSDALNKKMNVHKLALQNKSNIILKDRIRR